jgi:hypothetical protein
MVSVTPRPRFTPGERTPGTHCTGGWVGPRAGLDTEARGKILYPRRGSNLNPVRSQALRNAFVSVLLEIIGVDTYLYAFAPERSAHTEGDDM